MSRRNVNGTLCDAHDYDVVALEYRRRVPLLLYYLGQTTPAANAARAPVPRAVTAA